MKTKFKDLAVALYASVCLLSCIEGEPGPVGPSGPPGETGRQGPPGRDGVNGSSAKAPLFSGFYRVYLQGTTIETSKNFVDSSQYLFFGEAWTFKLYKEVGDTCTQVNQGTVDWGANSGGTTYILTDSLKSHYYEVYSGKTWKGITSEDLLGCAKCELHSHVPCSIKQL